MSDSSDALRAGLHGMWGAAAPGWDSNADHVDARGAAVTERLLALAAVGPGDRVLELGCGPGGAGIAAAGRVGADGAVVLSDVAPAMVEIAARRASGLANVSTLVLDIERIEQPDGSYDVVLCREALMLVVDPAQAVREIARVLRPGGRAAVAVWGPREANPWLGALFDAVASELGVEMPPPGLPGPFSLSDGDRLAALLREAGLAGVTVEELDAGHRFGSLDEWWSIVPSLAGPLALMLASLPDAQRDAIRARAHESLRPFETPAGVDIPGVALVAAARRA